MSGCYFIEVGGGGEPPDTLAYSFYFFIELWFL